jgi:hypothetical protein
MRKPSRRASKAGQRKNQAAQGALGAERHQGGGVIPESQQQGGGDPPRQQQQQNENPGQTGTPGGKGKQDAPQNQKR